jgi:hypothetical protein
LAVTGDGAAPFARTPDAGPGAVPIAAVVAVVVAAVLLAVAAAVPFFVCTTFIGDDHLFLAFARHAPNPLVAFVRDQHGGEYYRPLPMLLWWALARMGAPSSVPFAAWALALHLAVAAQVGWLVARVGGGDRRAGFLAAALFLVSPFNREAAYWYAASTDLMAAAAGLGAVHALLGSRRRPVLASSLFAAACLCKESAVVVPLLAALALRAGGRAPSARAALRGAAVMLPVLPLYVVARTVVLGGVGGSGDPRASVAGKLLQIASGWIHALTASDVLAEPIAWALGVGGLLALALAAWVGSRRRQVSVSGSSAEAHQPPPSWAPWCWLALASLPLVAAPWVVGARYFYLGSVGIAWLAGGVLARLPLPVPVGVLAFLVGLGVAQDRSRHADVTLYRAGVAAARRAVAAGLRDGHATFHIASGIKDLDLAVKEDAELAARSDRLLVLGDVPASFVLVPERRIAELDFLLARPPLPPSGAYRFGDMRAVGLARRGDDPTIDEVLGRFPDIRFIRLRAGPGGRVIPRDVTEALRRPAGEEGDD